MIEPILLQGPTGSGKTTSFRNVNPKGTLFIKPNNKPLPWKGGDKGFIAEGGSIVTIRKLEKLYEVIFRALTGQNKAGLAFPLLIVEDGSHFFNGHTMSDEFAARNSGNEAFARYTDLARLMYKALFKSVEDASDWCNNQKVNPNPNGKVVFINHTEEDSRGKQVMYTPGSLFRKDIRPEGYFRIVLHSVIQDDGTNAKYMFQTQGDSMREAKSPIGMFDEKFIENDFSAVLESINKYDAWEVKEKK